MRVGAPRFCSNGPMVWSMAGNPRKAKVDGHAENLPLPNYQGVAVAEMAACSPAT